MGLTGVSSTGAGPSGGETGLCVSGGLLSAGGFVSAGGLLSAGGFVSGAYFGGCH